MKLESYIPRTHQVFYCYLCDENKVDSQDPKTGKFHLAFGHSYDREKSEYCGEYTAVMFATCAKCAEKGE